VNIAQLALVSPWLVTAGTKKPDAIKKLWKLLLCHNFGVSIANNRQQNNQRKTQKVFRLFSIPRKNQFL
jgi:hypothetical protein